MKRKLITALLVLISVFSLAFAFSGCGQKVDGVTLKSNGNEYTVTGLSDKNATEIFIPSTYNGKSVTSIEEKAFENCYLLIRVHIPESITTIGRYAFRDCRAVFFCEAKEKPTGWDNTWNRVTGGQPNVIWDCKNNDKNSNGYAYAFIDGIHYSIKNSATTVYKQPYNISGDIEIPDKIIYKDNEYKVTGFAGDVFDNCREITSVSMGCYISKISSNTFSRCTQLSKVLLGTSVQEIESGAFLVCTALTEIRIPKSLKTIGYYAFFDCNKLTNINYSGTKEQWNLITKAEDWDKDTGDYIVHCSDGKLDKSGKEIN